MFFLPYTVKHILYKGCKIKIPMRHRRIKKHLEFDINTVPYVGTNIRRYGREFSPSHTPGRPVTCTLYIPVYLFAVQLHCFRGYVDLTSVVPLVYEEFFFFALHFIFISYVGRSSCKVS
jgi:hypothetical protein